MMVVVEKEEGDALDSYRHILSTCTHVLGASGVNNVCGCMDWPTMREHAVELCDHTPTRQDTSCSTFSTLKQHSLVASREKCG